MDVWIVEPVLRFVPCFPAFGEVDLWIAKPVKHILLFYMRSVVLFYRGVRDTYPVIRTLLFCMC